MPVASRAPRLLFASGLQLHPTISGGTLRSVGLADALGHHGFEVRVHSLTGRKPDYRARRPSAVQTWPGGTEERVERGPISALAWLASGVLGPPPLWITAGLAAAAASPREALLSSRLREQLRWCDAVVADFPFLHPVFSSPSAGGKLRVLSTHNIEHHLFDSRTRWNRLRRAAVRRVEIRAAEACDVLVACCAEDARFFAAHAQVREAVVVPNGIDPRRFRGIASQRAPARRELGLRDDEKVFLFTASRWPPNREAFDDLLSYAKGQGPRLREDRIHILVVGNVVREPVRLPGFTALGRVDRSEPYFAAADAALNPIRSGAGTNVKMCEYIAARLPILTTRFGARGFALQDGRTAFLFEPDGLGSTLSHVRRLFDEDPARLLRMADEAYARNQTLIDMDACVQPLVDALRARGVASAEGARRRLA